MRKMAAERSAAILCSWQGLADQRPRTLGMTHCQFARPATGRDRTGRRGDEIGAAQLREQREDLLTRLAVDGLQRLGAGEQRFSRRPVRVHHLMPVEQEVEILGLGHVIGNVDAVDLQKLLGRDQNLERAEHLHRHFRADKNAVLPDHLGLALPHPDHHPVRQLAARLDAGLNIDILDDLRAEAQRQPVFYRTDTHWTSVGCQIAYRRICESLGVTPRSFPDPGHKGRVMAMDLGNKLTPEVQEDARFLPVLRHARRVADNAMVRYNESEGFRLGKPRFVGCHIRLQNDADHAVPQSVVIFGDSFSEFRPHLLTAMLAETFREVHFVWSTSLDHDFIARIRPDIVITEIAERFVNKLPGDDFRVPLD